VLAFIVIILNGRDFIVVSKEEEAPHTHQGILAELIRMCNNWKWV